MVECGRTARQHVDTATERVSESLTVTLHCRESISTTADTSVPIAIHSIGVVWSSVAYYKVVENTNNLTRAIISISSESWIAPTAETTLSVEACGILIMTCFILTLINICKYISSV